MSDMINHPPHYTSHPSGVECIQIVEHMPFNVGAAMKYLWRCNEKHPEPYTDLEKAIWYIQREITRRRKMDMDAAYEEQMKAAAEHGAHQIAEVEDEHILSEIDHHFSTSKPE